MTVFEKQAAVENALQKKDMYAMYLRKSRADIELEAISKEETLSRHKKMLYALAEKHNIVPSQIVVYHEIVSGDSIDDRPEVQRLLKDVYNRTYKGVLVVEIERLARGNTKDQGEVADAFTFSNTLIITPAKVYDPNNEFDQEYFEFGLFMSRREYKTIRRRMESGKEQSVREGNYILSCPPYGFEIRKFSKKDIRLVEKPEESRIVKMIFDWYTEDRKPTSWIAKQLTLMGVPTQKNRREWSRNTIKDILFNVHYIGKVKWGEQVTVKQKDQVTGKVVKVRRHNGDVKIYEGKHDGFISEDQFNKVKTIYGKHAQTNTNTELVNPLSGIMVCKYCGRAMGHQRYPDIRKSRYHHPRGVYACKVKSLHDEVVMNAIVDALNAYIEDFKIKMESGQENKEAERQAETIAAMEKELAKQERMRKRLFESWEADDGTYTREEFIERKQMYAEKIGQMQAEIEAMKKNTPPPINYEERIIHLREMIECIRAEDISAKEKNIFLKRFIEKITYDSISYGPKKGGEAVLDVYLK